MLILPLYVIGAYLAFCVLGAFFSLPELKRDVDFLFDNADDVIKNMPRDEKSVVRQMFREVERRGRLAGFMSYVGFFPPFLKRWTIKPWEKIALWWRGDFMLHSARWLRSKQIMESLSESVETEGK
jgi:hypothetical protein